jgi:hypothetical protein
MKRRNETAVAVEILKPSDFEQRRRQTNIDNLDALVQQRVAEIFAERDGFIFEPFFRTRQVAYEIRRLQTVPERKKWGIFFERHGCLSCQKQDQPHASNGLCNACHGRAFKQLKEIVTELMNENKGGIEDARRYLRPCEHGQ